MPGMARVPVSREPHRLPSPDRRKKAMKEPANGSEEGVRAGGGTHDPAGRAGLQAPAARPSGEHSRTALGAPQAVTFTLGRSALGQRCRRSQKWLASLILQRRFAVRYTSKTIRNKRLGRTKAVSYQLSAVSHRFPSVSALAES